MAIDFPNKFSLTARVDQKNGSRRRQDFPDGIRVCFK
jgi:hypothetical protein